MLIDPGRVVSIGGYREGIWTFYKDSPSFNGLPVIVCDEPDKRVLHACVLSSAFDSFVFYRRKFGFESVSWPTYRLTLEGEGVDHCFTRILGEVPRISAALFGERDLREDLMNIKNLELRLAQISPEYRLRSAA